MPLLIFILCMMGLLLCKYEPFLQEVSVESQVTIKARGPLVSQREMTGKKLTPLKCIVFYFQHNHTCIRNRMVL